MALTAKILFHSVQGGFQERHRGGDPGDVQHRADGGQVRGVHGVPGGEYRVLVGDVDGAAVGRHPVLLGQFGGQLRRRVPVQVQAGDGPAVPGEPVGGGPADAAFGADSGDDDGALRAAGHGIPPVKAGRGWRRESGTWSAAEELPRAAVAE